MPSKLRTPSPPHIVSKNAKIDPEVHCLDPDGDVDLILTRFVTFEYDEAPKADDSSQSSCETGSDSSALTTPSFTLIDGRIDDGPCEEEVMIRVSSRHLILISPVFRAMLQRRFNESNILQRTGSVEIPLPDDDPDAFLILLNIIHGRIRKVPLEVDLQMLTQLAILVDKYEIHECVEMFTNLWFAHLQPTIPERYTEDIPSWICICWVFGKNTEFKLTTRLLLRQRREALPMGELPIPISVVDALNGRRQETLGKIVSTLVGHLNDYLENEHCSFECDALMVGALTKRLRNLKILPHCPDTTYNGVSFEDFTYRFKNGLYFPAAQRTSTYYYSHGKCAIRSIDKLLAQCEERLGGMELGDFKIIP